MQSVPGGFRRIWRWSQVSRASTTDLPLKPPRAEPQRGEALLIGPRVWHQRARRAAGDYAWRCWPLVPPGNVDYTIETVNRVVLLLVLGATFLVAGYFAIEPVFEAWLGHAHKAVAKDEPKHRHAPTDLAPLSISAFSPPVAGTKRTMRTNEWEDVEREFGAAELEVNKGQALVDGHFLPTDQVKAYLDGRVVRHEIEVVIIFPGAGAKMDELFPFIDACRRSKVREVLLNDWRPDRSR
jgi:hypothetical protein